ncbi:MAG: hypothetical protein IT453_09835 [Planctomycetes bacterium]|nr:hypothetical protein [Planctomycetota bacterium]
MLRLTLAFTVVLLAVLTFHVVSLAARNHAIAAREAEAANRTARLEAAEAAKRAILEELASEGLPEWAGEYVCRTGFTTERVFVAPRTGFVYFGRWCAGNDALAGNVVLDGDALQLATTVPTDLDTGRDFPGSLVPVRKGPERFLLRGARKVIAACNESSGGRIPALSFAHIDNTEEEPVGRLVVPPSFRKYQLETPIVGRVTFAGWVEYIGYEGKPSLREHIRLDVGADQRALVGMTFFVPITETESGHASEVFTVESAEPGAELELFAYVPENTPLPRVGAIASTSSR